LVYPAVANADVEVAAIAARDPARAAVFAAKHGIRTVHDSYEALRLANDTRYGLQASIFTNNVADALRAFQTLDFGGVLVNEVPTWRADQQPYGGVRDSGNTREGPAYSVREMTELRMVVLSP